MSLVTYHFPTIFLEPELKTWVIGSGDVLYISPTFKDLKQWQMADFLNHLADRYTQKKYEENLSEQNNKRFKNDSFSRKILSIKHI